MTPVLIDDIILLYNVALEDTDKKHNNKLIDDIFVFAG